MRRLPIECCIEVNAVDVIIQTNVGGYGRFAYFFDNAFALFASKIDVFDGNKRQIILFFGVVVAYFPRLVHIGIVFVSFQLRLRFQHVAFCTLVEDFNNVVVAVKFDAEKLVFQRVHRYFN